MNGSEDFNAGMNVGQIQTDIETIKKTLDRIETSLNRGGERMGNMEEAQRQNVTSIAVLETKVIDIAGNVTDLKGTRSRVAWAIIGSYASAFIAWTRFHK